MAKKDNTAIAWAVGLGTLAVAGIGIVLYERSQTPAIPAGGTTATNPNGSVTVTNPDGTTTTMSQQQLADLSAALAGTTVSNWETNGIPASVFATLSPAAQAAVTSLGIKQV